MLSFSLLGSVVLEKNGEPLTQFRSPKEAALLIYLAQTGQSQPRELIAELLWDNRSTQQSLSNLRTALTRLRNQVDDELLITRKSLVLATESQQQVDSVILLQTIGRIKGIDSTEDATTLQQALDTYRGDFLADFTLPDAPQFDAWAVQTLEEIRRQVVAAYAKLGQYALATEEVEFGMEVAHGWLRVDRLDEDAYALLIQLLLGAGKVRQAVAHYEHCVDLLHTELGVDPSPQLTALIHTVESPPTATEPPSPTFQSLIPRHNLPPFYNQFVDREIIQQELHTRLDQPWCRLVSIVGLGGVGKTRLATGIARDRLNRYQDGVWFVELADVDPDDDDVAEAIVIEIATALDLRLSGAQTPTEQLLAHLQHKAMLLVLDNFELLLGGVHIVLDLLQRCEQVQLIVTSREALQIRAEWTIALGGLSYPTSDHDAKPTDAVKLFIARQMQNGGSGSTRDHDADNAVAIRTICRLVEGLPLAIELAAALTSHTSPRAIAESLRDGFDALTTPLRDMPQRHRGLHIVFEMSWRTLTPALQERLARLAVFRGGFTKAAAAQVADADDAHLAALHAKSLLTYTPATDRYTLHAVIQAYAATKRVASTASTSSPTGSATNSRPKLVEGHEATDPILQKHAHYYLTLLAQQHETLQNGAPQHAVTLLQPDIDNVRLAWQTGLAYPHPTSPSLEGQFSRHRDNSSRPSLGRAREGSYTDLLLDALTSLSIYYQLRGLASEGEAVMQTTAQTAERWGAAGLALATRAGLERARFQNRLGRYRPAMETIETALNTAQQCADPWAEGMGHVLVGESLWRLGEYDLATTKLNYALTIAHALKNSDSFNSTSLIGWCHHHLGVIDDIQGRFDAAREHLEEACTAWRAIGNAQGLCNSLNSTGLVLYHQGNFSAAQQAMEQALTLCNQLDNRHLLSWLLNNLSIISTEQCDYLSAHHYLQIGLELATQNGNLTSQGEIYNNLGRNYRLRGEMDSALEHLEESLRISGLVGNHVMMAVAIINIAHVNKEKGDSGQAESLYNQALEIAQQGDLQYIECEALIGMAELLGKNSEGKARKYIAKAAALAGSIQNSDLIERANAINYYLSVTTEINENVSA